MKSKLLACRRREALHLPPELLSIISGFLQDAADVIRFRSVCRSWRLSTPLLHKISPLFPVEFPSEAYAPSADPKQYAEMEIQASAVYLLRPRRDPTKAWVVHAQETAPGKLIFRHALTLTEIPVVNWPDLSSSDEWSSVTQIARTYNSFSCCRGCKGVEFGVKFALIVSNSPGLNTFCKLGDPRFNVMRYFVYVSSTVAKLVSSVGLICDFVQFNGQIYAARDDAALYVLDHTSSTPKLVQLIRGGVICDDPGVYCLRVWRRLVVWDGHLYIVLRKDTAVAVECYRLVTEEEEGWRWEKVEDLGGGVVFINKHYTFAVSARDLPPPWRGDSVVYFSGVCSCSRSKWKSRVFELGAEGADFTTASSFKGYSDLFAPP